MITAVVRFKLPQGTTQQDAKALYEKSVPRYQGVPGLVRKYYLYDAEKRIGGGVYLWKSKADAEAVYTPQWQAYIAERYGAPPEVRYFETSVVVDNEMAKVLAEAV